MDYKKIYKASFNLQSASKKRETFSFSFHSIDKNKSTLSGSEHLKHNPEVLVSVCL